MLNKKDGKIILPDNDFLHNKKICSEKKPQIKKSNLHFSYKNLKKKKSHHSSAISLN